MEKKNLQDFMETMNGNISYKTAILPLLPKGRVNILDVGGGTGVLSHAIKMSNPNAHITLVDHSEEMLKTARKNNTADLYVSSIEELPKAAYDAVVLCSVLHEIPEWQKVIGASYRLLKIGGVLIIRDGYDSSGDRPQDFHLILKNPTRAKYFFDSCDENSIIGGLDLRFEGDQIIGKERDVKAFLQTYTWGLESLHREQHENHLFATLGDIAWGCKLAGFDMKTFKSTPICQQNYFKHLDKLVELTEMWNTHIIVKVTKNKE